MIETLSSILQNRFGISEDMVKAAQESAKKQGESLKDSLIKKKIVTEKIILKAVELQYNIPFWDR